MFHISAGSGAKPIVYDQRHQPGLWSVIGPRLSLELNQPGEFQFLLVPGRGNFYETCQPMTTFVCVVDEDDGTEIFYGRVLTRSNPVFKGQVTITCEGALSFLLDADMIFNKGVEEKNIQKITVRDFLTECLRLYNKAIGNDADREIQIGTIDHAKADQTAAFKVDSYTSIQSVIQSKVLDEYGGYISISKNSQGKHVLNWVDHFDAETTKPIQIGENIIDQNNRISGENIFNVIRPIGKNGLELPSGYNREWMESDAGLMRVFYQQDVESMGRIIKTVTFSDKETVDALYLAAHEYVEKLKYVLYRSCEIKMVDFHYLNPDIERLRLGDTHYAIEEFDGIKMTVSAIEMALEQPEDGTVTLKNEKELESIYGGLGEGQSTGGSSSSTSLSRGSSGGYGGGQKFKYIQEGEELLKLATKNIQIQAEQLSITSNELSSLSRAQGAMADIVEGHERIITGTGLFQNEDILLGLAGVFTIDQVTGIVRMKDGASLGLTKDGITGTVGEVLASQETDINGLKAFKDEVAGSTIWQTKDQITNFVGNFTVVTDANGKKTVYIEDGAGIVLRSDGVEQGVYTDGTLTGGIIIQKINGGGVSTSISGDKINIAANSEFGSVQQTVASSSSWIDQHGNTITQLEGSTMWQQKDMIANVVGEFEYVTDQNGITNLVVKNGSAFKLMRNGSIWGLYDEGSLTGGIMIQRINNDETSLKIKASRLNIQASDFASMGIYTDDHFDAGFIAQRLTDTVTGENKTLAQVISDVVEIDANQIDLSNVDIINLVNNNTGTTKINASRLDISGKLNAADFTAANIEAKFTNTDVTFGKKVTAHDVFVYDPAETDNHANVRWFIKKVERTDDGTTDQVELTFYRSLGDPDVITFNKAAAPTKMSGTWASGVFTAVPNANGSATLQTSLTHLTGTNYAHWGKASDGEDENRYYGAIGATINGKDLAKVYSYELDATVRYNAGQENIRKNIWVGGPSAYSPTTNPGTAHNDWIDRSTIVMTTNTYYYTISAGESSNTVRTAYFLIDAEPRYNAGYDAVDVTSDNWSKVGAAQADSTNTLVVSLPKKKTNGNTRIHVYGVNMALTSWADGQAAVELKDSSVSGQGNLIGKLTVNLPPLWLGGPSSYGPSNPASAHSDWRDMGTAVHQTYNASYYVVSAGQNTKTAVVGYFKVDASMRYIAGWNVAAGSTYSSAPTTKPSTLGTSIVVKLPKRIDTTDLDLSNVPYGSDSYTYYLAWPDNNHVGLYYRKDANTGIEVAQVAHNKYTEGQNSVYVKKGNWSSGVITFSPSAGTGVHSEVRLTAAAAEWDGDRASVKIWDGRATTVQEGGVDTGYTVTVDAGSKVSAAYDNGYDSGYDVGYAAGKLKGWQLYYNDSEDWIPDWDEGNGSYSVWIPKETPPTDYIGNGTSDTCEKWFTYTKSSGGSSYSHNANITKATTGFDQNDQEIYLGILYYKSGNTYLPVIDKNRYWYYSSTNITGKTVYW